MTFVCERDPKTTESIVAVENWQNPTLSEKIGFSEQQLRKITAMNVNKIFSRKIGIIKAQWISVTPLGTACSANFTPINSIYSRFAAIRWCLLEKFLRELSIELLFSIGKKHLQIFLINSLSSMMWWSWKGPFGLIEVVSKIPLSQR